MRLITAREIRKTLGRFLAIFAIVALGVGFFSGLRITTPVMVHSINEFYREYQLFDYRLVSTLGWNESEVEKIRQKENVRDAEGAWQYDVILEGKNGETAVYKAHSLTNGLNGIRLTEGRMPENETECVMDSQSRMGCHLGDTVFLSDENKTDTLDAFCGRTFTIVGFTEASLYLNFERGTTSIGNGSVAGYLYLPAEAFANDYYTDIYVKLDSDHEIYSDQYIRQLDSQREDWENETQEEANERYDRLYEDAEEELTDARKEFSEKKEDGEKELSDAEKELSDAKTELDEAEPKLADARKELDDGKKELDDGERTLDESQETLDAAYLELLAGKAELDASGEELDAAKAQLDDTVQTLTEGQNTLDASKAQLDAAKEELDSTDAQLTEGEIALEAARQTLDETAAFLQEKNEEIAYGEEELASARAELDTAKISLDETALNLADGEAVLDRQEEQIDIAVAAGLMTEEEAESSRAQIQAARENIQEGWAAYEAGMAEYLAGEAEYEASFAAFQEGKALWEAQRPMAEAQYEEGLRAWEENKAAAEAGRTAWNEGKAKYEAGLAEYEAGLAELEAGWEAWESGLAEYESGLAQYNAGVAQYNAGVAEYESGLAEWQQGKADLESGRQEYEKGLSEYEENLASYQEGRKEYEDGLAEYEEGKETYDKEIADAEKKLSDAEKELADFERPDTWLLERNTNIAYACFESDSQIVRQMAGIFPVFFMLVAALVCMTTMTRMVEEQRGQIGVLKGLGYSRWDIMKGFLFYSGSAAFLGCLAGYAIGVTLFPAVIWYAYQTMYIPIRLRFLFDPFLFAGVLSAAMICSLGTTWLSCRSVLQECAAGLMRPKSPKAGKRIFLEYVPFIWKRLTFMHKVSVRNIFRYKKRLLMMMLGIGGCMALLLTGFGLKDSITGFAEEQFDTIQVADAEITWRTEEDKTGKQKADGRTGVPGDIDEAVGELHASITALERSAWDMTAGNRVKSIDLLVPFEPDQLGDFFRLQSPEGQPLTFPGKGEGLISQSIAERYGVSPGDSLTLRNEDLDTLTITVSGVFENYVYNYVIISRDTMEEAVGDIMANSAYVNFPEEMDPYQGQTELADCEEVTSVTILKDFRNRLVNMMEALNYVVLLVIASAAGLAFVVLYNLTNINIIERIREVATIKVLGFFKRETSDYILRENLILTVFGVIAGIFLGRWLHRFVMSRIIIDLVCFPIKISPLSYLWSVLLTFGFTAFVNFVMGFRLEKINMAESLKSVE